ncbi:MAG: DNA/RNA non-specific endonuclease [Chitinophagales bacterium]
MDFKVILAFILGVVVSFLWTKYVWPQRHQVYTWIFALRRHKRIGDITETDLTLKRKGYTLGYDFDKRAALWVSYVISKASAEINWERSNSFKIDEAIPEAYRAKPTDFTNSGYDKGHLAPSAGIDFSRDSNDQTFLMSNIVFQHPKLNRQAWRSLENLVLKWTKTKGRLNVVTGPIFGQRNERINEIAVPKAFFKIVYSPKHGRSIGFVTPNEEVKAADLWNYAMSVEKVEEITGYHFLEKLHWRQRKSKFEIDLAWWRYGAG